MRKAKYSGYLVLQSQTGSEDVSILLKPWQGRHAWISPHVHMSTTAPHLSIHKSKQCLAIILYEILSRLLKKLQEIPKIICQVSQHTWRGGYGYSGRVKGTQLHPLTKRCQSNPQQNHLPETLLPFPLVDKLVVPLSGEKLK